MSQNYHSYKKNIYKHFQFHYAHFKRQNLAGLYLYFLHLEQRAVLMTVELSASNDYNFFL